MQKLILYGFFKPNSCDFRENATEMTARRIWLR
jgi:hypothetical protein